MPIRLDLHLSTLTQRKEAQNTRKIEMQNAEHHWKLNIKHIETQRKSLHP